MPKIPETGLLLYWIRRAEQAEKKYCDILAEFKFHMIKNREIWDGSRFSAGPETIWECGLCENSTRNKDKTEIEHDPSCLFSELKGRI